MLSEGRRRQLRVLLAIVLDACTIAAAFSLAYLLRFYWEIIPAAGLPPVQPYFEILPVVVPVWIAIFAAHGLYQERQPGFFDEALRVTSAVSVGLMVLLAGSFFYRQFSYSRLWILFAWVLSIVLVLVSRGIMRMAHRALRGHGVDLTRVLIVGTGPEARDLARVLHDHAETGQRPVAFVNGAVAAEVDGLPVVGRPDTVLAAVRQTGAHRVIIALPPEERETILQVAAVCQEASVPFAIVPDLYTLIASGANVELVDRLPLLTLHGSPLTGWGQRLKDTLDVVGALVGVIVTLPLWVMIAVVIVTGTSGPLFYRQKRIGKAGVPFFAWKFRTMVRGAEEHLARDVQLRERFSAAFKLPDDPRVTRIGRWLRRTSLDELPQLLNVLKGEMSLVGPRPITEDELRKYGPWERRLLCVKPGLTGLWQVLRHDWPDYAQRVRLDMYYIDHWSVGLDFKILLRTLPSIVRGRGAY
jgi:exopolysaccharide biosynthesis polyprenyl glycosylphosphotransferase